MTKIEDLMTKIYLAQLSSDSYDKQINELKESKSKVDNIIEESKAELLSLIDTDDPIECDNMVAKRFHKSNVGYTSDSDVLNWLKNNYEGKFIKTKITESLDKTPLKKELKTNTSLQEGLKEYILNGTTDYVVVTNTENFAKMMEHIEKK